MAKRKSCKSESAVRATQEREEDLESIYSQLRKKHGDSYSGPQLSLWARMILSGTTLSSDGNRSSPKASKTRNTDALAGAATAFVNAFRSTPMTSISNTPASSVGFSSGKAADICMKNLQQ